MLCVCAHARRAITKPRKTNPSTIASPWAANEVGSSKPICPTSFVMRSSSRGLESRGRQVVAINLCVEGMVYANTKQYLELPLWPERSKLLVTVILHVHCYMFSMLSIDIVWLILFFSLHNIKRSNTRSCYSFFNIRNQPKFAEHLLRGRIFDVRKISGVFVRPPFYRLP